MKTSNTSRSWTDRAKRVLSFCLALAMLLSLMPALTLSASAATPSTLYLVPNSNWKVDNARFAAYFFGNGEKWVDMTDSDKDGVYEVAVPSGYPSVIFCRMSPTASANNWTNKWNQTNDLTIPSDGTNCYTVAAGTWDKGGGTWSTVTPEVEETTEATEDDSGTEDTGASYYIAGTFAYGGWNAQNADDKMTNNGDGTYTMVYEGVAAGTQSFKVTDGTWTNCWGGSGTNTDADGNYVFTLSTYSKVTITFTESTKAITVSSEAATAPVVNDVTVHYRNTGAWTTVNAYAWIQGTETTLNGAWPGDALTENADHSNWYTLSLNDLDAEGGIGVIFDNGTAQTGNINITADGEYWYDGELLTEAPDTWEDGSVKTVDYKVTLHFANSKNWGGVYLYTWNDFGTFTGSWPGSALGQGEDGFYSATFTYEAPEGQGVNYIYSGNNQTGDLTLAFSDFTLTDGVYTLERWVVPTDTYKDGDGNTRWNVSVVTDPEAIAISPVVNGTSVTFEYAGATTDTVEVYGTMNDWASGYAMTSNSHGVHSVTIDNVAYGIHQYKIVVNGNWITDPLNSWIETEANGNQNSAFLISNPDADVNEITINVHYTRTDGDYTGWNVFAWGADDLEDQYDFADVNGEKVATIELNDGRGVLGLTFKVRKSVGTNDWAEQSGEIYVDLSKIVSGTIDIDITDMTMTSQSLNADVVYDNKLSDIELNYTNNTIAITSVQAIADPETELAVIETANGENIIDSITATGSTYTLTLTETMDLVTLYQYKVYFDGYTYDIGYYSAYATDKFAEEFTYEGEDLGATWTESSTTFKVWAPTAESVRVQLYSTGSDEEDGAAELETYAMTKGTKGEWTTTINGNLKNVYYTYVVKVEGETVETVDPYARTVGVNGDRGMIIDLDSTDPEGWSDTTNDNPNPSTTYTDAIIWELHVRDFSIDADSGVSEANRGKYMAFTEEGTMVPGTEIKTGIDYIDELGVTHVHLLPVYDYGSVDETTCDTFNWGYDPKNYNAPEGSYSTNPYDGNIRVNEYKQMVDSMHEHGISVIMDVVYNHVYNAETFCFNVIVPGYFSRQNSNASGCGNDTASEREMVRKYIVESVLYWAKEYHLDGFRFDLVGLLDVETINEIVTRVHEEVGEDIIFYGEGWDMDGTNREPGTDMAKQHNADKTPGFGYFSDEMRNTLAGSNGSSTGFVSGATGVEGTIVNNIMAKPSTWGSVWTDNPSQIIQYASCHDNYTLIDKLVISTGASGVNSNIIKMNNLAAAIYMNSMGIPFIHAGEEFLREKLEEDGGRCENSYNASDYVNHIEWSVLKDETYSANVEYYKGLIEFRKAHPALRLSTATEVAANVSCLKAEGKVVVMQIDGANVEGEPSDSILLIYNANSGSTTYTLPSGEWTVCINGTESGNEEITTASGTVTVAGISAMVLVQGELENKCSHNYEGVVTDPTCTADGYTTYTCSLCGDSYTGDVVATKGHSYSNGSCSVCGEPDPDYVEPTPDTVTVYFQHSVTTGTTVYAYSWHDATPCTGTWPGTAMTYEGDGLYSIEVPVEAVNIIFNDGSNQTDDLTIPYDDRNVFTKNSSDWSGTWDEEVTLSQDYYLIGYINGANYGDGEDYANLGDYKFVNGKVTVTFTNTSYVCVKNGANTTWYMTDGWAGSVTSVTLLNTSTSSPTGTNQFDKLMVPDGEVTFTLVENNDGTLTLSYTTASSGGETGSADDYYLFGYIDRANYGVEEDSATLGEYKFDEDGKLTTSFKADSYVGVKTGANTGWYQTNGWLGSVTSATLYDSDVYTDFAKYDKLFVPGGVEITFTLVVNDDDTVTLSYEADTTFFEDASGVQDGVTLHAWNWSFDEIADKMDEIAAAGYTAVQTSPIQPLKQSTTAEGQNDVGGHWWVYYQPVDFIINTDTGNALGTKSDFEAMCAVADQYGIKIIVDVVANHLANASGNDLSTAIPSEIRNTAAYWHDYTTNTADYTNRYDITQHCMAGLPDLNTGNQDVQDMVLEFLKECVDAGADGFRFDAAKHIETPEDDTSFASDFWPTVIEGVQEYAGETDLYIYGELLDEPGGALPISAYTKYMAVTDNSWGNTLRGNIAGGTASLTEGYNKVTDASNLVLWAESHDTYANTNGGSTSVSVANINKTWALVAARADAMGLYFVRPENLSTSTLGQSSTIGWMNDEVVAVNQFHNYFAGQGETLDNEDGILYIERGTSGVVLVNVSGSNTVSVTANAMADGTYTDQITGNTFTVANGTISGTIGSTGIAVVYNVAEEIDVNVTLKGATLSLVDEIHYNIFFITDNEDVAYENTGLLVWNAEPADPSIETADKVYEGAVLDTEKNYLKVTTDGVAAKNMGDALYFAAYAKVGDQIFYSDVKSYSALQYAKNILSKSTNTNMKKLCLALMDYGAAAQEYFAAEGTYTYDELMNAGLAEQYPSYVTAYSADMITAVADVPASKLGEFAKTGTYYKSKGANMTLTGALALNYYFTMNQKVDSITLYYWTKADYNAATTLTKANASGSLEMTPTGTANQYSAKVENLVAKTYDDAMYVAAIYEVDGVSYCTGAFGYSMSRYCSGRIANSTSAEMVALAKALVVYGNCAKTYFNYQ